MIRLFTCIQSEHSFPLLAMAVAICSFGSWISINLFERCLRSRSFDWVAISGFAGGTTIWSTHFIAMLAYSQQLTTTYAPTTTILSLLSAIVTTTAGLSVAWQDRRFLLPELGGAIVGLGGSLMHFIGMLAYEPEGLVYYDAELTRVSILVGGLMGSLAVSVVVRKSIVKSTYVGAGLLVLCIVGLHTIAMAAVTVAPDGPAINPSSGISKDTLAVAVFIVAALVVGVCFFAYSIDRRNKLRFDQDFSFVSHHDALTGLPNRACFEAQFDEFLAIAARDNRRVVIQKVNITSMHELNEVLGNQGGDAVLVEVSRRLKALIAPNALLARMSGTRFILVADCADLEEPQALPERVRGSLELATAIDHRPIKIRFRIGVVVFPRDGASSGQLMANVNIALERARHFPGNSICYYDETTDEYIHRKRILSQDIQVALDLGQFELYFQPQCDLLSMKIVGFEGLLRWRHPELGSVPPSEFIPIAEQTGLILPIGIWVLNEGCKIASSWPETSKVALNLSPVQLKGNNIYQSVLDAISLSGLPPHRLELEITESTLMESPQETLREMLSLQSLGVSIALDDFGAGYSSLGTLSSFPFDKIKLDKSFLDWTKPTLQVEAIVGALLKMGQKLGMKILAEGVETDEQIEFLRAEGCNLVQGYVIGKPMPANKIDEWMSEFDRRLVPHVLPTELRSVG